MRTDHEPLASHQDEDAAIHAIFEGTAAETGERFFAALVKNLALSLNVSSAWVTEYLPESKQLRALSFWFEDHYIGDYCYNITGTPCEPVVEKESLIHYADNIVALFPHDSDLEKFQAVSYIGVPLADSDGRVLGHLAAMDTKPMRLQPRVESLLRIFAARATAELQRLRAEADVREREEKLSRLVSNAMDAIIELDSRITVTHANPSTAERFLV